MRAVLAFLFILIMGCDSTPESTDDEVDDDHISEVRREQAFHYGNFLYEDAGFLVTCEDPYPSHTVAMYYDTLCTLEGSKCRYLIRVNENNIKRLETRCE